MRALADIRHSARSLAQRPAFVLAMMLTVALGIGSNAAVLGFMNGLVSRETPLADTTSTTVSVLSRRDDGGLGLLTYAEYLKVKAQTQIFDAVLAARETRTVVNAGTAPAVAAIATVTPEARAFFGLPQPDGVVISDAFRAREFGSVPTVTDQHVAIDGTSRAVAGVAPVAAEGLYIGRPVDLWVVIADASLLHPDRDSPTLSVLARLREGTSIADVQDALDEIGAPGAALVAHEYTGLTPEMQEGMSRLGRLMPAVAGALFLIACANVAVFLLSRAASRSHDTSVRMALGATRATLARAALVDSALIATAGAAAGLIVGRWTSDIVPALLFQSDAERMTFVPDAAGLITAASVSAIIMVCCGMVPLLENRHDTPAAVLRREPRRPSAPLRRLRSALVILQLSMCCALVISAATVSSALDAALRTRAGERLGRPILATVEWKLGFSRPDLGLQYFAQVAQTVAAEPGISSVAWTSTLPGRAASFYPATIEPPGLPAREVTVTAGPFTPRSLARVALPPKAGRMMGGQDTATTCRVAVAEAATAASLFQGTAVGRVIEDQAGRRVEIVGVVERRGPPSAGEDGGEPSIYYYAAQEPQPFIPPAAATFNVPILPPRVSGMLDVHVVSDNYFSLMGLPLRAGTLFAGNAPTPFCRVGVVNEEASQVYFGGNAVGGAVIDGSGRRTTIVGVVQAPRLRSTERKSEPSIYVPMAQDFLPRMHLILGSTDANAALQASVRRRLEAVDGGKPGAIVVISLDDRLRQTALASERIAALLLSTASINALALGILGLYRVIADDVIVRRREIALRSALGAQRWRLILMVARQAARVAIIGGVFGTIVALLLVRWLRSTTGFEGTPMGVLWLAGPLILALGALVASVLPARRILAVDPLSAMRID